MKILQNLLIIITIHCVSGNQGPPPNYPNYATGQYDDYRQNPSTQQPQNHQHSTAFSHDSNIPSTAFGQSQYPGQIRPQDQFSSPHQRQTATNQGRYAPSDYPHLDQRYNLPNQRSVIPFGSKGYNQNYGQQQPEGIFSRLKSTIAAAGAAISGADQPQAQYPSRPPSHGRQYMTNYQNAEARTFPSNGPYGFRHATGSVNQSPGTSNPQKSIQDEGSFIGKLKNLFNTGEDAMNKQPENRRFPQSAQSAYGPPPGYMQSTQAYSTGTHRSQSMHRYDQSPGIQYQAPTFANQIPSETLAQTPDLGDVNSPYGRFGHSFPPSNEVSTSFPAANKLNVPTKQELDISPEPQLIVVDDCIVLIPKPKEYYRKKIQFTAMGAGALQVFTDFEHVLTKFKLEDGSRTIGTAESLESSPALSPQALSRLRAIADEFNSRNEMDYSAFDDFTSQCQNVIAKEGGLHVGHVPALTRESLPRMPLRDGWKEAIKALGTAGVPLYVFSSGYGDLIVQTLLQSGAGSIMDSRSSAPNYQGYDQLGPMLPQNIRVISNFFRTGPDGTVRAFSSPIVHERNKNATTAAHQMNMPLPDRPNALIFGTHEDDVSMTFGIQGLKDQLSIGFLEFTEDISLRLPTFLNSFDAVILGDSSFLYCKSLIEDILQIQGESKGRKKAGIKTSFFDRTVLSNIDLLS